MESELAAGFDDLKLGKITKFRLAPGEEMMVCPYDMSHCITNLRMINHLIKCRRNYAKACELNGDMVQMIACKYNWCHQVPIPELLYHENTCQDRYAVITYILQFSDPHPTDPDRLMKTSKEVYRTSGVPSVDPNLNSQHVFKEDSVVSKHLLPKNFVAGRKKEVFDIPVLRLKSAPKASHVSVTSLTTHRTESDIEAVDSFTSKLEQCAPRGKPKTTEKKIPEMGPRSSSSSSSSSSSATILKAKEKVDSDYEWELDPTGKTYDPKVKFSKQVSLKYPMGLTKSERRAWKNENVKKVERMYGGTLSLAHKTSGTTPSAPAGGLEGDPPGDDAATTTSLDSDY